MDDAPESRDLLAGCLGAAGYQVQVVNDRDEALVQVAAEPPDLTLLDLLMRRVDGDEVCRRIKADCTTAPLRLARITVTVTFNGGSGGRPQTVSLETMRAE